MRDMIGNKLEEGVLVFWLSKGVTAVVKRIDPGGLSVVGAGGERQTPPTLTLEINIPVSMGDLPRGAEPAISDFLRVVDPRQQAILERALDGKPS